MFQGSLTRIEERAKVMDAGTSTEDTPLFRIMLWGPFRVEKRVGEGYEAVKTADWGGSNYPRLLLKALLCCSGRRSRREALLEMLWPELELEQATTNLNTATTKLRSLLRLAQGHESLLITEHDATIYQLPNQEVLWVDGDAVQRTLGRVEHLGRTSAETLPLLEEVSSLASRGTFLEGEEVQWVAEKRASRERERYRGQIWLAESYEQQAMPGQAETILTTLLEHDPFDEDVLCRLLALFHHQGMTHQALLLYRQTCSLFAQEHMKMTEATQNLAMRFEQDRRFPFLESERKRTADVNEPGFSAFSPGFSQVPQPIIMQVLRDMSGASVPAWTELAEQKETMNIKRRELLQILSTAGLALALPFTSIDWERIEGTLGRAPRFDETVLHDLEMVNRSLWSLYLATPKKASIFDGALGQWKTLVQFLRDPHSTAMHQRLYILASEISQLVGEILFDLNDHASAHACYTFAALSAKEAGAYDLWSCSLVRHAFLPLYRKDYGHALPLLQEASTLAQRGDSMLPTRFWVAAVEAETHAGLLDLAACQEALDHAQNVIDLPRTDIPWARFTSARLPALRGTCYVRLSQPRLAEPALQEALKQFPHPDRKRGMVLTDLAATALQCSNVEQARSYVDEVASIVACGASGFLREELRGIPYKGGDVSALPAKEMNQYIEQQLHMPL